jgi:hypothetical protein
MHQYVPLPDGDEAGSKLNSGASDVVKYSKQELVWKQVNHRRIVCAPVTLAYPTQLKVSARSTEKLKRRTLGRDLHSFRLETWSNLPGVRVKVLGGMRPCWRGAKRRKWRAAWKGVSAIADED